MDLSYLQRLYRSGDAESLHRYTLIPDHPDFTRARLNALHLSDVSELAIHGGAGRGRWCLFLSIVCAHTGLYLLKTKALGRRTWDRRSTGLRVGHTACVTWRPVPRWARVSSNGDEAALWTPVAPPSPHVLVLDMGAKASAVCWVLARQPGPGRCRHWLRLFPGHPSTATQKVVMLGKQPLTLQFGRCCPCARWVRTELAPSCAGLWPPTPGPPWLCAVCVHNRDAVSCAGLAVSRGWRPLTVIE